MKICLSTPPSPNAEPWYPTFEKKGVKVYFNSVHPDCDFIISIAPTGYFHLLQMFHNTFPDIPMIIYLWDMYKTIWEPPIKYNWPKHIEYFKKAAEVWCPSNEVIKRAAEEGVDASKCKLIKTWARFFDYKGEVVDKRYILQPVRSYPNDKNHGWLKRAAAELNIPVFESQNKLSDKEFQKVIAECSFMCCEYHEMSTGGLTLLEGYNLGKVSVVSDSPYEGVRDYLGDRAIYFNDDSYEDFKATIKDVWDNTPVLDRKECEDFCRQHVTLDQMVDQMIERLEELNKNCPKI
tara:strand:- start:2061 stop:2936 length:876 start_codon:yes stop_codon:yes gene_type:complete